MRPLGTIGGICSCGAVYISTPQTNVFSAGLLVLVSGAMQSHGGLAIPSPPYFVFIGGLPVVRLADPSDVCRWVWPPHLMQPLVVGDPTVNSA